MTASTKLYFKVPNNWSKCYIYYFPNPSNNFPGDEIFIGDSGYYEWDFSDLLIINPDLTGQHFMVCQSSSDYIAHDVSFTLTDSGNIYEVTGTTGNYAIDVIGNIPGDTKAVNLTNLQRNNANLLSFIKGKVPTVNDGALTIKVNGVTAGTFTANQATNEEIDITAGGTITYATDADMAEMAETWSV